MTKLLRFRELSARGGKGRTANWADRKAGLLTEPIKIGARAVAWPEDEIDAVLNARIAGSSDEQIRMLVRRLMDDRKNRLPAILQPPTASTGPAPGKPAEQPSLAPTTRPAPARKVRG